MSNKTTKTVVVSDQGVQFGNAWFSHESITGYSAEQLNAGTCGVTGGAYMTWLSTDEPYTWMAREAALREELANHDSASKLMDAWVLEKGQMPWVTAINIMAIVTKMPDEERQRLIDMDDGSTERGALIAERDALQQRLTVAEQRARELESALINVRETLGREYWDQYAGLDETRDILDAALKPAAEGEGS